MAVTTATREAFQRAIKRSAAAGGAALVTPTGPNRYEVAGHRGAVYSVTVLAHEWRCGCVAGLENRACYHAASVWLYRVAQSARGVAKNHVDQPVSVLAPESVKPALPVWNLPDGECEWCYHLGGRHRAHCPEDPANAPVKVAA